MKIDKNMISILQQEHERRTRDAALKLIKKGDLEGARSDLEWIETSSRLIAAAEKGRRFRLSIIIAVLCLLFAGLAWVLRVPLTPVSLKLVTENVFLELSKDWSSEHGFKPDEVFVDNVSKVDSPGLNIHLGSDVKQAGGNLSLKGKKMSVEYISLASGAGIDMGLEDNRLNLFIKDSPLKGELLFEKADLVIELEESIIQKEVDPEALDTIAPETIYFETAETSRDRVRLELVLGGNDNWRIHGLQAGEIGFFEERPVDSGNFESTILSGEISLLKTGETEALRNADGLIIKCFQSRRIEISNSADGLNIIFEGLVSRIRAGPQGFEKNLMPTYLEYAYHQKYLAYFGTLVATLWGVMWGIWRMFLRRGLRSEE